MQLVETIIGMDPPAFDLSNTSRKASNVPNAIVDINNRILDAGYNVEFTVTDPKCKRITDTRMAILANSVRGEDIEVYINNILLEKNVEYRWDSSTTVLKYPAGIAKVNDAIDVFLSIDGEYAFGYVGVADDSTPDPYRSKIYFDTAR